MDRRVAMKITGHKTEHIFERYNIKTTDDVREALIKVGKYKPASIASNSSWRRPGVPSAKVFD